MSATPALVAYFPLIGATENCDWCPSDAQYRIESVMGTVTNYGCEDCTANHMRGNASALDGAHTDIVRDWGELMGE